MAVTCQILINKPSGVHRPGHPVSGVVKYALNEPLEVNSVVLSLDGRGNCSWSESNSDKEKLSTNYYGDEEYFKTSVNIIEKTSDGVVTIPVGSYELPFNFCLPENIPPSFKNDFGRISYVLRLKFKRPRVFQFNKTFTAEIPVRSCINGEGEGPLIFGLEKTPTKPFSKRKHVINLKAEISKSILIPGEHAHLNLVVKNDSSITITATKSELVRYETYTANCGHKRYEQFIIRGSTVQSPSIPKNSLVNLNQEIPISSDMYSILNSEIIKVEFKVRVTARLPLPHINALVEVPVVIGDEFVEQSPDEPPSYWEVVCVEGNEKLK